MLSALKKVAIGLLASLCWTAPALSQSVVTSTSGRGSVGTVVDSTDRFVITGGQQRLNTLFHSLDSFSPQTTDVLFQLGDSQSAVQYVIGRVTGNSASFIQGELALTGGNSPDLFLINPNGITFAQGASLSLPGSFVGSTAESVLFAGGRSFSAINPGNAPFLTMSAPVGLQLGEQSGALQVSGDGHQLTGGLFLPHMRSTTQPTLAVNAGETIALVGRSIDFSGGVLTADSGRVELGGVTTGVVDVQYDDESELQLAYDDVDGFGDVDLAQRSLVDTSGLTSRGIRLQGQDITLTDGSTALIQVFGNETPSDIQVHAANRLSVAGSVRIAPDAGPITGVVSSRLIAETLGASRSSDIEVVAKDIHLDDGGLITNRTYTGADGGGISVDVSGDVEINRSSVLNPRIISGIATANFSTGGLGDIAVEAVNLTLTGGGLINTTNFGQGDGGNLDITASDTIEVSGIDFAIASPSSLGSTVFRQGNGGNLEITTARLILRDGGAVAAASLSNGNGGNVVVNASDYVSVAGSNFNGLLPSQVSAAARVIPEAARQAVGLPDRPTGDAGSVVINTPVLAVANGGNVSVNNQGTGNGGVLTVNAETLQADRGYVVASTASGEGGNINLNLRSVLRLRNNSVISAEALSAGNGGNIIIDSPVLLGIENSDIIANAVEGDGGNVAVSAQSILGLAFREMLTAESDITASSQFGVNGIVEIDNLTVSPGTALAALSQETVDADSQVTAGCSVGDRNQFIASGRGGLAISPVEPIPVNRVWTDIRNAAARDVSEPVLSGFTAVENTAVENLDSTLLEAASWNVNRHGQVELYADATGAIAPNASPACLSSTHSVR